MLALSGPAQAQQTAAFAVPVESGISERYLQRAGEVVIHALALMGVNYRYGGDSPTTGFDCSGLVVHVVQQVAGILLPRNAHDMSRVGRTVTRDNLEPGDLVFFNTLHRPYSHVGIYLGNHRFIHAPSSGRAVEVVNMADSYWQARYNGARRLML
jgi:cell wall-associated NlpC family hydrolase